MQQASERINAFQSRFSPLRQNRFFLGAVFIVTLCLLFANGRAKAQGLSAVETAELGVNTLLATALESKALFLNDRESYFAAIEADLESFVDFTAVANVVMARYAADATPAQTQRFATILKTTLTRFYGASLVSYNGEELVFLPNPNPSDDPRADTVVSMELRGDINLQLRYQMFITDEDTWKLKNLSLAGINLGRQYYSQFSALMSEHDNDIDAVLDNWR
ncbi:MAG: ABC transporter substrate-binding protein [Proteobacteria bacterium]|nr:ABC transporter substrate-binding protein [Pseudomonadota bacterium]MDA0895776.1 ABC transporter substrate-binding protein [Pseudomonadota bacterium]MDA1243501.1 ABC transporter substrate-binding protein [Pseudomonadota bacterium]